MYYTRMSLARDARDKLNEKLDSQSIYQDVPEWVNRQFKRGRVNNKLKDSLLTMAEALDKVYPGNWEITFRPEVHLKSINSDSMYGFTDFRESTYLDILEVFTTEEELKVRREENWWSGYMTNCYKPLVSNTYYYLSNITIDHARVVIRFPEIDITNSREDQHTIRELFVRLFIMENGYISQEIEGARLAASAHEIFSNYGHSHLGSIFYTGYSGDTIGYNSFCTGTGEIGSIINFYNANTRVEQAVSLLLMLKSYLSWESLEGGPYRLMSEIGVKNYTLYEPTKTELEGFFYVLKNERTKTELLSKLNWVITDGAMKLIDDQNFENLLFSRLENYGYSTFLVFRNEAGQPFYSNETDISFLLENPSFLEFRGEKINFTLVGELPNINKQLYCHPQIKSYVKQQLEKFANKVKTDLYTTLRLYQVDNNRRIPIQSEVLL